jgi:hypothetical protein
VVPAFQIVRDDTGGVIGILPKAPAMGAEATAASHPEFASAVAQAGGTAAVAATGAVAAASGHVTPSHAERAAGAALPPHVAAGGEAAANAGLLAGAGLAVCSRSGGEEWRGRPADGGRGGSRFTAADSHTPAEAPPSPACVAACRVIAGMVQTLPLAPIQHIFTFL